jgi:hypothetical protein
MPGSYHSHAPWRKAVLIPFWILQICFEVVMIGVIAVAAGYLSRYESSPSDIIEVDGSYYEVDDQALNVTEHRYGVS